MDLKSFLYLENVNANIPWKIFGREDFSSILKGFSQEFEKIYYAYFSSDYNSKINIFSKIIK